MTTKITFNTVEELAESLDNGRYLEVPSPNFARLYKTGFGGYQVKLVGQTKFLKLEDLKKYVGIELTDSTKSVLEYKAKQQSIKDKEQWLKDNHLAEFTTQYTVGTYIYATAKMTYRTDIETPDVPEVLRPDNKIELTEINHIPAEKFSEEAKEEYIAIIREQLARELASIPEKMLLEDIKSLGYY